MSDASSVLRAERDLYKQLLELGSHDEIEPLLRNVLALVVEMAKARKGYLGVGTDHNGQAQPRGAAMFSIGVAASTDTMDELRASLCRGVIAEVMATGTTVVSMSAHPSVRASMEDERIEEILCVPIGSPDALGVIYLQDRTEPGPFADGDRARVETVAARVAPFVDRLLLE